MPATATTRLLTLGDGTRVQIRPIRPADAEIEQQFIRLLSSTSRYQRFFHRLKELSPQLLYQFTHVDYSRDMALIATLGEPPDETQIGVARFVRSDDQTRAEFAVVVADEWQGQGIATALLSQLFEAAEHSGIKRIEGAVLRDNQNMQKLMAGLGFCITPDPNDVGVLQVYKEISR